MMSHVWQRNHRRIGHILRPDRLLHEITEGRMRGKPTRGRRRIQMQRDLTNDDDNVELKWQQKTEKYGNTEKGCQKPAEDY